MLIDAVNFHDEHKHEKTDDTTRYYVKRCFGKKKGSDQPDNRGPKGTMVGNDEENEAGLDLFLF